MEKRLYRSRTDKTFTGVCGGFGKLVGLDPTIVRVIYAVVSFFTGVFPGIVLYVILACIIPEEPQEIDKQPEQAWQPYQAWTPPQEPQREPPQEPQQENPPADASAWEPPAGDAQN